MLSKLLDEWRKTFDEALVEPICALGAQAAKSRPPLRAKRQAALEEAWHARIQERDPSDVDVLLAAKWPKQRDPVMARLQALAVAPADPRIPPKLLEVRGLLPSGFDPEISRVLARSPTLQLGILLDGYRDSLFGSARAALLNVRRRAAEPKLVAEARAALVPPAERRVQVADPTDAERSVIADELLAAGDPRGELIALQLAIANGTASATAAKRADKLLGEHLSEWLRPFPNAVPQACRFERGYPVAIVSTARGNGLQLAIDRPEWATVEELTIDGRGADLERLLRRLSRLRSLSTRDEVLDRLAKGDPFRGIRALGTPSTWFPRDLRAFPDCVVLAGSWCREVPDYEHLQPRCAALGLRAVVYVGVLASIYPAMEHIAAGPPVTRFTVVRSTGRGWYVSVERDTKRAAVAWAGGDRSSSEFIETVLEDLARGGMREIAVFAEGSARSAVEYTLRNARNRFAGCNVHFDGAMIDLAFTPVAS